MRLCEANHSHLPNVTLAEVVVSEAQLCIYCLLDVMGLKDESP